MVKNLASTTGGVSSIPAWETEIPHAVKYGPPPKKGQKISTVEEIWEPSCTAGQNGTTTMQNSTAVPQKTKNTNCRTTQQFYSWILPQRNKNTNPTDTHMPMFTEALFTVAKIWKQGFSDGSAVKNSPDHAGNAGLISESGRSPREEVATHSSIPDWEIPWTE